MVTITPGSSALSPRPRALYIGTAGTIDIANKDGTTISGLPVVAGTVIPCSFYKITAASSAVIHGIYD
jgi:hypothetical protein